MNETLLTVQALKNLATKIVENLIELKDSNPIDAIFKEYIKKSDVKQHLAGETTLWKLEKEGKLQQYSFGGNRFYKKEDVLNAFEKVVKKKDLNL